MIERVAIARLNLTQSTVSHAIKKLRLMFGDPLFVRSGRGIMPTERARSLREQVIEIFDSMKRLSDERAFDPTGQPLRFRVAANDLTRDLLFTAILSDASKSCIDLFLTFMPSGVPPATLLYDSRCDLIVTPLPPDGLDIIQQKLFEGEMACIYDSAVRRPPSTWEEYKNDKHIMVRFADGRSSFNVVSEVDRAPLPFPCNSVSVSWCGTAGTAPIRHTAGCGNKSLDRQKCSKACPLRDISVNAQEEKFEDWQGDLSPYEKELGAYRPELLGNRIAQPLLSRPWK